MRRQNESEAEYYHRLSGYSLVASIVCAVIGLGAYIYAWATR